MRNIWTIAKKEFSHYFISPIAYAVAFLVMLWLGILFYINTLGAVLSQFPPNANFIIGWLVILFLFTIPAITMRTIAEEQKQGTLETLLTAPVRDTELVIGKWLGSLLFCSVIIALTWIYPLIINRMVEPAIDLGLLISGYLGVFLAVSCFLAVGVFVSSLFSNQIAAFFATLIVLLICWFLSIPTQMAQNTSMLTTVIQYLDLSEHFYNTLAVGLIQFKDILYFVSFTTFALFLGAMSVETRRWR